MNKILIIQTAFLGDVVLATSLIEKWHSYYPDCQIDMMIRKGNESLLHKHPLLNKVWVWDKQNNKYANLWGLLKEVRSTQYDLVVNVQRFGATGAFTALCGAKITVGFQNNPFAWAFTHRFPHKIGDGTHEVARNQQLISLWTDAKAAKPVLYPTAEQFQKVQALKTQPYICIAPTSVWFTKQFPKKKWIEFLTHIAPNWTIYLLGSPTDKAYCQEIIATVTQQRSHNAPLINLCGQLNLLESAALMKDAAMNYVNDSAPLHLASAVDAPVCAIFCSTVPTFGFTPLSTHSIVVSTEKPLACRPCGLHGYKACPKGHFDCGNTIDTKKLLEVLKIK